MDQFAWFVDAGYLYAAGGALCLGERSRSRIEIDFETITRMLGSQGREQAPGERYLRTYWYDGAEDGIEKPAHRAIARQPGVKLRLGRTVPRDNQAGFMQKGVDSLIVRDLMRLSQNRAISTAFLLGGDEDLRQGVVEAQEMGVRVVLVGIEPFGEQNQAGTLIRETDDLIIFNRELLSTHFRLRQTYEPTPGQPERSIHEVGVALGRAWRDSASLPAIEELQQLSKRNPSRPIPLEIDRELLERASTELGGEVPPSGRPELRRGFLDGVLRRESEPGE